MSSRMRLDRLGYAVLAAFSSDADGCAGHEARGGDALPLGDGHEGAWNH